MANLGEHFDANTVEPNAPRTLLPAGDYTVQICKSEMRDTAAKPGGNPGKMLSLELEVLDGEFKGRRVFDNLNLVNDSQQTVDIARGTLSAICRAVGKLQVTDSEQLHWLPIVVTVTVGPDGRDKDKPKAEQRTQNSVKGYAKPGAGGAVGGRPSQQSSGGGGGSTQQAGAGQKTAAAAAEKPVPAWRRNRAG